MGSYNFSGLYNSLGLYNAGSVGSSVAQVYELQQALSILAGTIAPPWMEAQQAANKWAGTSDLDLLAALNVKNGTTGLDLAAVCNALAGTVGMEAQDAMGKLAGGGWD